MTQDVSIRGMHCAACVASISRALRDLNGVRAADVTLDPPAARIESDAPLDQAAIATALRRAGDYSVAESEPQPAEASRLARLYPLLLIVAYLVGTVAIVALATGTRDFMTLMRWFMGGFFVVFSFFKLLDLRGFAAAFGRYDPLAAALPGWGRAYPFVEAALGAAYLLNAWPITTNVVTLILMTIGAVGVFRALLRKQTITCACLGTVLNLPMTGVTLVEDTLMAAMAAAMLIAHAAG
jgi:copper chaperone CopZ